MCLRLYSSARKTVIEGKWIYCSSKDFLHYLGYTFLDSFSLVLPLCDVNEKHLIIHSHQGFTAIMP